MAKQNANFKTILLYETKSKKRWPEKSAGRVWAMWVEALIFLDLLPARLNAVRTGLLFDQAKSNTELNNEQEFEKIIEKQIKTHE